MNFTAQLQHKIDTKTKPLGALGHLEKIALQIGTLQQTVSPCLNHPTIVVFAADHGIAKEGVSAYPPEVTYQMVLNFLQGGAAINVFSEQHGIRLLVVDAGVNVDFEPHEKLIVSKIQKGTNSFLTAEAMTMEQLQHCLGKGREITRKVAANGSNVIGFGEMGIGNTSSASMIMSYLCALPIESCVGRGTGLTDDQLELKIAILKKARAFHGDLTDPMRVLQAVGGFEIAHMCGAMLEAYEQNMLILVDGFIASSAFLVAVTHQPAIVKNAIFCHLSDENGHRKLLNHLQVEPILQLNMRLGEGTGCAIAYPIIQSALLFLDQMASFESASVSNKQEI